MLEAIHREVNNRRLLVYSSDCSAKRSFIGLHGGYTDPVRDWGPVTSRLETRFNFHLPAIPGHVGWPEESVEPIGPESLAHLLLDLRGVLQDSWTVLAGYSLGARAAMVAAECRPEAFGGLILLAPRLSAFTAEEFASLECRVKGSSNRWSQAQHQPTLSRLAAGVVGYSINPTRWANRIAGLPALVLIGDNDRVCPATDLLAFKSMPNVELIRVPGGHRVQDGRAAEVAGLIDQFVGRLTDGADDRAQCGRT